jgi:uncharacterized membrane-anchored protein
MPPPPDIIAAKIADDLEAALAQFTKIAARLGSKAARSSFFIAASRSN